MKETLIEVLMHIFNQIMEEESLAPHKSSQLIEKLEKAGADIHQLGDLNDAQLELITEYFDTFANMNGTRILSDEEKSKLGDEGWRYLLNLEKAGVIPAWIRELILYEVCAIEEESVSLDELKEVILQVMQKIMPKDNDIAWLEHYLFYNDNITVH